MDGLEVLRRDKFVVLLIYILLVLCLEVYCDVSTRDAAMVDLFAFVNPDVVLLKVLGLRHSKLVLFLALTWLKVSVDLYGLLVEH